MLSPAIAFVGFVALAIGVVVTGAGPHAGDANAPRNELNLEILEHVHSYPAYLVTLLALISLVVLYRVRGELPLAFKVNALLVLALLLQAAIGIAQARMGVPPILVGLHMLGASVIASLLTFQWLVTRAK